MPTPGTQVALRPEEVAESPEAGGPQRQVESSVQRAVPPGGSGSPGAGGGLW